MRVTGRGPEQVSGDWLADVLQGRPLSKFYWGYWVVESEFYNYKELLGC